VARRVQENREAVASRGTGGAGGGGNPINALFAPMFADLKRQRQLANQRYEANSQQVTNIYGQITGARSADKAATETAFKRLVDAASTRSTAVNEGIDASEAARLQQNQAALQGMGLEGLSTSQGDIASQTAAQAQQTNTLNSANWENMLRAMGATAGQQVDADVAGFNYAMAEDLGRLRGAREEFAQELGQQRGQLKSQRAQATFEYQQAQQRAAASAQAAQQRAAMQMATEADRQMAEALKASGPAAVTIDAYIKRGKLSPEQAAAALNAITEFYQFNTAPRGKWFSGEAKGILFDAAGDALSKDQKDAISAIFDQTLPKG
jgi:VIT1/CCC1 family predicted Fe2+/Mn2+ transporter